MKILPISDIHGKHEEIFNWILDNIDSDEYDVVIASGDLWEGQSTNPVKCWKEFQNTIKKPIVAIQGNHDYCSNTAFDDVPEIHLLHNEGVEIDGVKFWGSPYTPTFCDWAHMRSDVELYKMWNSLMPNNLDVLLTHGPSYSINDNCLQSVYGNDSNSKLGSKALYTVILDKSPKYHFCGHIHSATRYTTMSNGTKCYNVSCLDESYSFGAFNPYPIPVELNLT